MKRSIKFIVCCSLFVVLFCALAPFASAAATTEYTLLEPSIPFIGGTYRQGNLSAYLQGLFSLGIGIAITLAILILVYNGIRYMVSDIAGEKEKAKTWSWNAIWGLLLAFSAWLILYTINPKLVDFDLIQTINEAKEAAIKGAAERPVVTTKDPGDPWPSDTVERSRLSAAGIGFNNQNCETVDQKGCTSVAGLSESAIVKLIDLKAKCNCDITITGGTEYWAHQTHGNNSTVDLRNSPSLRDYLGGIGSFCGDKKIKDGITFHWEDNSCPWRPVGTHWHVPL